MDQPLLLQARELEKVAALSRFEALEGFVEEEFQLQTYLGPGKLVYIFHQPDPPVISRSSSDSSNLLISRSLVKEGLLLLLGVS